MKYLCITILCFIFLSCNEKDDKPVDDTFNRSQMLSDYAEFYIIPNFAELNNEFLIFESIALSITDNSDNQKIEDLKKQFKKVYLSWQKVAMLNFGPSETFSLLNVTNIFPANKTKIIANIQNDENNLLSAANIDAIGLPCLDFLLFSDDELLGNKFDDAKFRKYFLDVLQLMKSRVDKVNSEWSGSYKVTFAENDGKSVGSGLSMIVNSLNKYWEKDTRDGKLGIPIGIRTNGVIQIERSEAFYSNYSKELLIAGVEAYINYFNNNDKGLSLYDYLYSSRNKYGDGKLHETIINNFKKILGRLNNLNGDLKSNIETNKQELISIYQDIQKQIVYLKVVMPSVLGVSITYQDNDGD